MSVFKLNRRVAAEVFEDECIIANLENGLYYSLQGNAIDLVNGLPCSDGAVLIAAIAGPLDDNADLCANELTAIWQELVEEKIISSSDSDDDVGDGLAGSVSASTTYKPSKLNRYTDMQDLLLLDPIHEVDEDGWEKKNL